MRATSSLIALRIPVPGAKRLRVQPPPSKILAYRQAPRPLTESPPDTGQPRPVGETSCSTSPECDAEQLEMRRVINPMNLKSWNAGEQSYQFTGLMRPQT